MARGKAKAIESPHPEILGGQSQSVQIRTWVKRMCHSPRDHNGLASHRYPVPIYRATHGACILIHLPALQLLT